MPVSKEFKKAMDSKKLAGRWKKAKTAKPNQSFLPDIASGSYIARISASADKSKKEPHVPVVTLRTTIIEGEYKGKGWNNDFYLDGDDPDKVQQNWDRLSVAMQTLCGVDEEEFDSWELADVATAIDAIDKEGPVCRIGVVRKDNEEKGRWYLNTYFNELLEEGEEDEEEEDEDESDEEESDNEEEEGDEEDESDEGDGEDGDADEEEEDGEEGIEDLAKGDYVWYKPKGKKSPIECEVKTVSKKNRTATLQEYEGKGKWENVSWDVLEIVESE